MFSFVDIRLALLLSATVLLARGQGEDDRKYNFLHIFKLLLEVSGCKGEAVMLLCDAAERTYSLRTEHVLQASSYSLKHCVFPWKGGRTLVQSGCALEPLGLFTLCMREPLGTSWHRFGDCPPRAICYPRQLLKEKSRHSESK